MKYLYFTRGNGDIDNMPLNSAKNYTTVKNRRDFIGDQEAKRFSIQDPINDPIWDSEKYIEDPEKSKESNRLKKKQIRKDKLSRSTVEVNGRLFQVRISDRPLLIDRIADMNDGDTTRWILANNKVALDVPKEDLKEALRLGRLNGGLIFDDYIDELISLGMVE